METQVREYTGTSAKKTNNSNSGKKMGILKKEMGGENNDIPYLEDGEELIETVDIKGTPFKITGNINIGYWAIMGAFRLTEKCETKDEVESIINEKSWELIGNFVYAVMAGRDMLNERIKQEEVTKINNNQKTEKQ